MGYKENTQLISHCELLSSLSLGIGTRGPKDEKNNLQYRAPQIEDEKSRGWKSGVRTSMSKLVSFINSPENWEAIQQ